MSWRYVNPAHIDTGNMYRIYGTKTNIAAFPASPGNPVVTRS